MVCGTFLDRILLRSLSLHTVEAYAYDLVLMKRWLEASGLQLAEMNSGHLHEFLAWERGRDSNPKSINRRLHPVRTRRHVRGRSYTLKGGRGEWRGQRQGSPEAAGRDGAARGDAARLARAVGEGDVAEASGDGGAPLPRVRPAAPGLPPGPVR